MKDKIECAIAVLLISTYCLLVGYGRISADSFAPIVMYVVKKFLDGVEVKRNA